MPIRLHVPGYTAIYQHTLRRTFLNCCWWSPRSILFGMSFIVTSLIVGRASIYGSCITFLRLPIKSSFIDSFLERSLNAFDFTEQIRLPVENESTCWHLICAQLSILVATLDGQILSLLIVCLSFETKRCYRNSQEASPQQV